MAETVRSLFDYREPPTLDSDGESSKPPPPRGRGCGRKRKGTPVKVCERVFATEDEEESMSEHSYGNEKGDDREGAENRHRVRVVDGQYYETQSAQLCVSDVGLEGSSGGRGTVSYPPPPNCRIREVHCGSQVRLIVIAIRDIAKGEEITVDYSMTEWGENALGFHGSVPPRSFECSSDHESYVKKEDESIPVPLSLSVSKYLTPSWSLSPSSSPLSHSEPSDSDDASRETRMRTPHRRKKHKGPSSSATHAKTKPPQQLHSHPPSFAHSLPSSPLQPSAPSRPVFKCPAPAGVPANSVSVGRGQSTMAQKQCCVYCGRHFRSLPRHLAKHHAHQPDMPSALEQVHSSGHPPRLQASLPSSSSSSKHSQETPVPGVVVEAPQSPPSPSLSPVRRSSALSSPTRKSPASPSTTPPRRGGVPVSVLKRSPPTPATPPRKAGRRVKKEKEVGDVFEKTKEEKVPTPVFVEQVNEAESEQLKEEREDNGGREEESGMEDKTDLSSSRRPHMLPLLSSLSTLVLYLRRLQHSAFISLSRSPESAEGWRLLCHSSLALLILYNRRRECEVSKLTISEYQARVTPQCPVPVPHGALPALTPLEASLSPFERMVLPHLPRVGVQGKRGRVQPLILPPHSEACLEMLLQTRAGVGIDPQNTYVFARPFHSPATPLRGTDLLRSLARSSGTRHPRALTQTRVRRQVAILTQLLLLSEGEEEGQHGAATERLESFLQKEYHVTQSCATIGQDPGLMGLIGRVVLCGERDGVLFRGMSLHHICLELDVLSGNSADSLSEESDVEQSKEKLEAASPTTTIMRKKTTSNIKSPRPKKMSSSSPFSSGRKRAPGQPKTGKRGVLKRPWSEAERAAVESHLVRNIMELRVPAKADCERCLELCPLLVTNHRDWRAVKFYCHNRIQLLKKTQQRQGPPVLSVC
ncbi:serine/arginine repetitive matrix protein 1-like [Myxocyprinus asiaticus]|uniref:serine/arginine repetitive matrix protein 1-like n=1 Tax=Myxocyprinus asiaticus TaxID=70543 RepID=UPI00222338E4|nr:serine/arginine repetitive matrix protein 1-like [Myxocyprinus asiaticus]